ncbi:SCO family protein [Gammaproteobacteria bacterium]|nr:SCO family protein [Gammaproteobacteria bacterium]
MKKNFPIGTLVLFTIFISVVLVVITVMSNIVPKVPQELAGVLRPAPRPLQPFVFKDQTGKLFTQAELEGKWSFLFFGYTYCPDICPTTLTVLTSMIDSLEIQSASTEDVQVVFVSVDPQRDKPEILEKYLSYFHDDFIGITAGQEETRVFADQFGAMFFKEQNMGPDNYLMAHTSSIFLVGPGVEVVASFSPPHDPGTIASQFQAIRGLDL